MAARGLRVEVPEKLVPPRFEWTDIDGDLLAAGHDFFPPQFGAFEFLWCWIVVLDGQRDFLAGRDLDFGWFKPAAVTRSVRKLRKSWRNSHQAIKWRTVSM